ncbi:hypothetical protein DSD19_04635 [Rhodovulum sp. BSW8]|uniref:hypothetical protein n=1 Tax=Rhodovulum sp. BSW8 TaxID=2259645 RepID=UPI000DE52210|nr:hypothetical protein [Rhodovulum sp. BSW8]RBO54667.1 hypothetical protein DSD19_04635 [Rhodovulum sp. BSW8]
MTIGDLERAAGIEDRDAFWAGFASVTGEVTVNGRTCDAGLEAGIAQLRWLADQRDGDEEI